MREKRDFIIIMWGVIVLVFLLIYMIKITTEQRERDFEYNVAKQGGVEAYIKNLGYGIKQYERFSPGGSDLYRIKFEDIMTFYIKRGYDVRYVRTGQYNGYYEAIKLKTN